MNLTELKKAISKSLGHRILEVMPKGHTLTAEDLGNAYGSAVDFIGLKYGLIRQ